MTRSSRNWLRMPGNFDPLHIQRRHYPAGNPWGFPDLLKQRFNLNEETKLLSYRAPDTSTPAQGASLCHFFLDDYRFESVWTKPDAGLSRVGRFWGTLTPDFSLYTDWPLIVQQWNHYRRQWLGRYWQEFGIRVIPTVNWSTPDSFAWCFAEIPRRQIVALAVPDVRNVVVKERFETGYWTMLERLEPTLILICGKLLTSLKHPDYPVREFAPRWETWRREKLTAKEPAKGGESNDTQKFKRKFTPKFTQRKSHESGKAAHLV